MPRERSPKGTPSIPPGPRFARVGLLRTLPKNLVRPDGASRCAGAPLLAGFIFTADLPRGKLGIRAPAMDEGETVVMNDEEAEALVGKRAYHQATGIPFFEERG